MNHLDDAAVKKHFSREGYKVSLITYSGENDIYIFFERSLLYLNNIQSLGKHFGLKVTMVGQALHGVTGKMETCVIFARVRP